MPAASPGSTRLWTGSVAGETLAAQALWGSGQHGLSPVLVWQGMLIVHGATWRAGRRLVSILVVRWVGLCHACLLLGVSGLALSSRWWFNIRTLGIIFQVPAGGRPIDGLLVEHPIGTTPVRKADGRRCQRVVR